MVCVAGWGRRILSGMTQDALRTELLKQLEVLLEGGQAHAGFEKAVAELPLDKQGVVPAGLPYSGWQILEHLRIAQRDILDFCTDGGGAGYRHMEWPAAYWPKEAVPPGADAWERSVAASCGGPRGVSAGAAGGLTS